MAPSKLLASTPTTAAPSLDVQQGVDMLWRHQLRKENAALLERLDESNKLVEAIHSETDRKIQDAAERISALEAKLSKIESEGKKMKLAKEQWDEDLAALKTQMGIITEKHVSDAQAVPAVPENPAGPKPIEAPEEPPGTPPSTRIGPEFIDTSSTASEAGLTPRPVTSPTAIVPATVTASPTTTGPITRSRRQPNSPAHPRPDPAEAPQPPSLPRLAQGTNALKTYHSNANTAFTSLPRDRQVELEFIQQFISGVREPKARDTLLNELQKAHACRRNKEGKVEVMCEWIDVAEGLRKAGLVSGEGGVQAQGAGRKRKKILIPRELIESGMMR